MGCIIVVRLSGLHYNHDTIQVNDNDGRFIVLTRYNIDSLIKSLRSHKKRRDEYVSNW